MAKRTIKRADIIEAINLEVGLAKSESSEILEDIIEEIKSALDDEGEAKFSDFGTFKTVQKKPRMGRNPKTKQPYVISARRVVSFKPSLHMLKRINEDFKKQIF